MVTLQLSAGVIFTLGFVLGLIVGVSGLCIIAVTMSKKNHK